MHSDCHSTCPPSVVVKLQPGWQAKCEWNLSATQEGAISSIVFVGLFLYVSKCHLFHKCLSVKSERVNKIFVQDVECLLFVLTVGPILGGFLLILRGGDSVSWQQSSSLYCLGC